MKTVSFTEFRKHASNLFSDVENGEKLLIVRHGKAIAEINPVSNESKNPIMEKTGVAPFYKRGRAFFGYYRGAGT